MLGSCRGDTRHRCRTGIMGFASFLVLVWIGSGTDHAWWSPPSASTVPSLGEGVVSGVFVAAAGCTALVTWRRHAGAVAGWIVATGALVAAQALVVTLIALHSTPPRGATVQLLMLAVGMVGMLGVVVPLLAPERVRRVADETFVIGLGLGLVAAGHLLLQGLVLRQRGGGRGPRGPGGAESRRACRVSPRCAEGGASRSRAPRRCSRE